MERKRTFAAVRPYTEGIRERVFAFLSSMQLELGEGLLIEPGTPDVEAARRIEARQMDLLLLPFHVHRDRDGLPVDGIGVLEQLSEEFLQRAVPVLMPVSAYSQRASFPRRLEQLTERRPQLATMIVSMPETEIGSPEIRGKLQSLLR